MGIIDISGIFLCRKYQIYPRAMKTACFIYTKKSTKRQMNYLTPNSYLDWRTNDFQEKSRVVLPMNCLFV